MRSTNFFKGHGTGNDFVIIDDQHGMHDPDAELVKVLCDRRFGVGGDGLLRVVRARHIKDYSGDPDLWFMDYRNADGSIAEMCGNGLRVFARYLMNEQLVPVGHFEVATRAGVKQVKIGRVGQISVDLGQVKLSNDPVQVQLAGREYPATAVDVGNPHAVAWVGADELAALDLHVGPTWRPAERFSDGVNVEFVTQEHPGRLRLRVFERGSGETMSCGTGVVAAAAVHRRDRGTDDPITVAVPGGELQVDFSGDSVWLTGPAVITLRGEYWF